MEIKKTPRADLERDKSLSLLMGLVIALAVVFVGFEWGEREIEVATDDGTSKVIEEEEIDITRQDEPPPPPPEPEVIKAPEVIEIVEDNVKVDDVQILSSEDDASQAQTSTYVAPVVEEEEEEDENFVFVTVEHMPEFPGGEAALLKWIAEHINYPTIAAENGIQGRVSCNFVVNTDGSVSDVQVTKAFDPNLDREAIRVLKMLPKFKPGQQRGKPVRVKYSVPVRFKLQQ
ncbi:MAG: energy transducer TonB [Tannerella sp.]|jgi:protein TonB|nr:energy transducer TonB [Tannerella sp.]